KSRPEYARHRRWVCRAHPPARLYLQQPTVSSRSNSAQEKARAAESQVTTTFHKTKAIDPESVRQWSGSLARPKRLRVPRIFGLRDCQPAPDLKSSPIESRLGLQR